MKKMKMITFLSAGMFFALASCEGAESIYDLDKAGEIEEIKKEIIAEVGDIPVYEVAMSSTDELETSLTNVSIVTNHEATEETLNKTEFQFTGEGAASTSVIDREFSVRVYKKSDPVLLSEIDFSVIEKNIETAKGQIPSEYVDHAVYSYTIQFDDNKRSDTFTINCLEEGESDHMEGRDIVTNYYEFIFDIDENGTVVMDID